jgi:hypothetical protein
MPNRPPKEWMERCIAGVTEGGSAAVPGAVCGSLWYHKKSPAERAAVTREYEAHAGNWKGRAPFKPRDHEHALHDLDLFLDNDRYMYGRKKSFIDAVRRKIQSRTYDPKLAASLWQYWVDEGARRYVKEFGGDVRTKFPLALREHLAKIVAKHEYGRIKRGEYD